MAEPTWEKGAKKLLRKRAGRVRFGISGWGAVLLVILAGIGCECAAEVPPLGREMPAAIDTTERSLGYPGCVQLALKQSPYLSGSSIEIDLRRIDESDSRYSVLPSLSVRTRFFVNQPSSITDDSKPYAIEFFTEPYNPMQPYYSIKARRIVTKIAVLTHLKAIEECLQRLASAFLELDALDRAAARQEGLVELSEELTAFTNSRLNSGGASPLEARMAEQEAAVARLEKERILDSRAAVLDGIKRLLGLEVSHRLELDIRDAAQQVLGEFSPGRATALHIQGHPTDLEILALRKELQGLSIKLARAKYLPQFLLRMESGDPLSRVANGDLYFSLGVEIPLWDGMKRSHDVTRQKRVLKQMEADAEVKDMNFAGKWKESLDKLRNAEADVGIAEKQAEIARMKERQSEIAYQSGRIPYSSYIAERKSTLESQKNIASRTFEKEKALLGLYQLSGELLKRYVDAGSF